MIEWYLGFSVVVFIPFLYFGRRYFLNMEKDWYSWVTAGLVALMWPVLMVGVVVFLVVMRNDFAQLWKQRQQGKKLSSKHGLVKKGQTGGVFQEAE